MFQSKMLQKFQYVMFLVESAPWTMTHCTRNVVVIMTSYWKLTFNSMKLRMATAPGWYVKSDLYSGPLGIHRR